MVQEAVSQRAADLKAFRQVAPELSTDHLADRPAQCRDDLPRRVEHSLGQQPARLQALESKAFAAVWASVRGRALKVPPRVAHLLALVPTVEGQTALEALSPAVLLLPEPPWPAPLQRASALGLRERQRTPLPARRSTSGSLLELSQELEAGEAERQEVP